MLQTREPLLRKPAVVRIVYQQCKIVVILIIHVLVSVRGLRSAYSSSVQRQGAQVLISTIFSCLRDTLLRRDGCCLMTEKTPHKRVRLKPFRLLTNKKL